jgi:hypothetical protein
VKSDQSAEFAARLRLTGVSPDVRTMAVLHRNLIRRLRRRLVWHRAAFKAPSLAYQSTARTECAWGSGKETGHKALRSLLEIDPNGACKRPEKVPPGLD